MTIGGAAERVRDDGDAFVLDVSGLTPEQVHEINLVVFAMFNGLVPDDLDCCDVEAVRRLLVENSVEEKWAASIGAKA